jgi:DNA-binding beta-propeller fold protein YncE
MSFAYDTALNSNPPMEWGVYSMVIDETNGFIYAGGNAIIAKISTASFTITDSIVLTGKACMQQAVAIDTTNGYVYFATGSHTIEKIRISDFTLVGTLNITYNAASLVIDITGGYLYAGISSSAIKKIYKIDLSSFTKIAECSIVNGVGAGVGLKEGNFLYFSTYPSPYKISKIDIATFTEVSTLTPGNPAYAVSSDGTNLYFSEYTGQIERVSISTFAVNATLNLETPSSSYIPSTSFICNDFLYIAVRYATDHVIIYQVNMNTFLNVTKFEYPEYDKFYSCTYDSINKKGYFAEYEAEESKIAKFSIDCTTDLPISSIYHKWHEPVVII